MAAKILTFEPNSLFRYRSLNDPRNCEREMASISLSHIWCAQFTKLNDPMEGAYRANRSGGYLEKVSMDRLFDRKKALGICSFSETNNNAIMWAHYADQFRGICVEYDFQKLKNCLAESHAFVRILYDEVETPLSGFALGDPVLPKRLLSSKSHRWLYEREWRLIAENEGRVPIARESITCVYYGSRIQSNIERRCTNEIAKLGIPIRKMTVDGYSIQFIRT